MRREKSYLLLQHLGSFAKAIACRKRSEVPGRELSPGNFCPRRSGTFAKSPSTLLLLSLLPEEPLPSPGSGEGWRRGKAAAAFYRQQFLLLFLFGLLRYKAPSSGGFCLPYAPRHSPAGYPAARRDGSKGYTWISDAEWFKAVWLPLQAWLLFFLSPTLPPPPSRPLSSVRSWCDHPLRIPRFRIFFLKYPTSHFLFLTLPETWEPQAQRNIPSLSRRHA